MITLGIDLAAQPERTATCRVAWADGAATVEDMQLGADDAALLAAIAAADKAGIDVPLGWPDTFVDALVAHRAAQGWPGDAMRDLRYRATDLAVQRIAGVWPLSVSSDRIGVTAMRAGALLARLDAPVDRGGGGRVVEVYPAVALRRWGFSSTKYKRRENEEARWVLVAEFAGRTGGWLRLDGRHRLACERSDDAFDALVAALVARAAALSACEPIPAEHAARAASEGWIAVPTADSLDSLA